jgi:hypothetical protein
MAGRDAKINWKALSVRRGHADVAFTIKAVLQVGHALASVLVDPEGSDDMLSNA